LRCVACERRLRSCDRVEKWVSKSVFCRNSLRVIQLEHSIEQVEGVSVLDFADFGPRHFFFLHFVRNQTAVAVLESDFFDGIGPKETDEWDEVGNCEILDLAAVVEREDRVSLCKER